MKKVPLVIALILSATLSYGQMSKKYSDLVEVADSLYKTGNYRNSALTYYEAFKANGWNALPNDRYNAACSYALAHIPENAFFELNIIAKQNGYRNYDHISTDQDLRSLHDDERWSPLLGIIKQNKEKAEANLNKPVVALLDSVYKDLQQSRVQIEETGKKYGCDSEELKAQCRMINTRDSINLNKVKAVLDKFGWLGVDVAGADGNSKLFGIILKSDLATQEKYLPMMKKAIKNGKESFGTYAIMVDKVALRKGRKQIYGSEIRNDPATRQYYVAPLRDPAHVDKRRLKAGLQPFADYLKNWHLKWDAEEYIKDFPAIEAKEKARRNNKILFISVGEIKKQ